MLRNIVCVLKLTALTATAGLTSGQTTRPLFYMWEVPPGFTQGDSLQPFELDTTADRWTFRADMQPIVKVYLDGSRPGYEQAAERTQETIAHWLNPDGNPATNDAVIEPSKLAIHVRNWGSRSQYNQSYTLLDTDDTVASNFTNMGPPFPYLPPDNPTLVRLFQPWMDEGRVTAKAWMEGYCSELSGLLSGTGISPARLHLESEFNLGTGNLGAVWYTRVAEACAQDARTVNVEFPWSGKTAKEEWEDAALIAGWTEPTFAEELETYYRNRRFTDGDTLEYWHFWGGILVNAQTWAIKECAFEPFKEVWPDAKVSEYGHCQVTLGIGPNNEPTRMFGWSQRIAEPSGTASNRYYYNIQRDFGNLVFGRHWYGGVHDPQGQHGAYPTRIYSRVNDSNPTFIGVWGRGGGVAYGDFSCPVLYAVQPGDPEGSQPRQSWLQRKWYEKWTNVAPYDVAGGGDTLPPYETTWEASLRAHRELLESLEATALEEPDPAKRKPIVPYILMFGKAHNNLTAVDADMVRSQLALLRSKDITEAIV